MHTISRVYWHNLVHARCQGSTLHLSLHQNRGEAHTYGTSSYIVMRAEFTYVCFACVPVDGIYTYIKEQRGAQSTDQPRSNASSLVIYSRAINPFASAASPQPEKIWKSDLLPDSLIYTRQDIVARMAGRIAIVRPVSILFSKLMENTIDFNVRDIILYHVVRPGLWYTMVLRYIRKFIISSIVGILSLSLFSIRLLKII